jgi:DNA/RNA endonuclease YhcR with UshA esterase domain
VIVEVEAVDVEASIEVGDVAVELQEGAGEIEVVVEEDAVVQQEQEEQKLSSSPGDVTRAYLLQGILDLLESS